VTSRAPVVMMTSSSSSSLCRHHTDLHSPLNYAPSSSLSAFLQSSAAASSDYRRQSYQSICAADYLPSRVTSASAGLHGDAMTHHLQQQRSPSFAIHELLGLHGPMFPAAAAACHDSSPALMFDCTGGSGVADGGCAGSAVTGGGTSYRQQAQFFPVTYHSSTAAGAQPSTPLSMPDLDSTPAAQAPPPPPLLVGPPPSCHRASSSSSSWPPGSSRMSHLSELPSAHAHRPAIYRDAYDVLQRNFKPDVTSRAFGPAAARTVSHKYVTHRTYYV